MPTSRFAGCLLLVFAFSLAAPKPAWAQRSRLVSILPSLLLNEIVLDPSP